MEISIKDLKAALLVAWIHGWGSNGPYMAHSDVDAIMAKMIAGNQQRDTSDSSYYKNRDEVH